ncbi:hypothetical protein F53441_2690 [Fusarium austroafricanum]|uniref:CBM-cenC domain-containing protein n=1 Tax=Fusarium austroafricanum TaxID=2364996 RepID=A0A8H4KPF9_9HYPO|nr:hypothetical protein F53441_2690 [Fusarium austroafricanum]
MRVSTTFGSLILSAGLVSARACGPHPRPTTTSSLSSEAGSTTAVGSATTKLSTASALSSEETLSATESETNVESSVTISTTTAKASTTAVGSVTTELASTTFELTSQETSTLTESQASVESSATLSASTTEISTFISSFTTELATTTSGLTSQETLAITESDTAVTLSTFETSTTVYETTSTTVEATTTSVDPPAQTTNLVQNGGFEDSTIEPWEVTGTTPSLETFCAEGNKCLSLPGLFPDTTAKTCQSVQVEQGFEYTFKAFVNQNCIASFGSNIVSCSDDINTVELSIDGVSDSGAIGILGDRNYHQVSDTFSYVGPSIDSTDLCITIKANQGVFYNFYLDGISLTRGKAVPIPADTD